MAMDRIPMQTIIEELIAALEQTASQYNSLLPILLEEKKAALSWNLQALIEATTEKQVILARIAYMDRNRSRLLNQLAAKLHLRERRLTLNQLAKNIRGPLGKRLSSLHAGLNDLMEKIRRSNEENRLTVEHCLTLVHNSLAFWQHWAGPVKVYGNSGIVRNGYNRGCVLSGSV
jgi:flagellar biosynthesis/type III secretory pathway chaperone